MKTKSQVKVEEQKHLNEVIHTIEELIKKNLEDNHRKKNDPNPPGSSITHKRIKEYEDARKSLYFGRVDVVFSDGKTETCYIGETPVAKDDTDTIIYNWQSPIGDAYGGFYGGDGTITFEVEEKLETIKDTLTVLLKRQLSIKNDKVLDYSDTYSEQALKKSTTNKTHLNLPSITDEDAKYADQFLINLLNETSNVHGIKKVIATIRKEQNEVIRLGIKEPILIQGVAGSGKSTIALNRISFLLYRYKQSLKAENILILAPNKMFLSYIEGVLPGLDISKIQQKTFTSFAKEILSIKGNVKEPYEILATLVNGDVEADKIFPILKFKGSIDFKEIIEKYLRYLDDNIHTTIRELKFNDPFKIESYEFTTEQIKKELMKNRHLPFEVHRKELYSSIEKWKNNIFEKRLKELNDEFDSALNIWVDTLPKDSTIRKQTFEALEKASNHKIDTLKKEFEDKWKEYQGNKIFFSSNKIYETILQPELLKNIKPDLDKELLQLLDTRKRKKVNFEDLAALIYIESKINGTTRFYDYIVIDEAQDLSPFQILVLKEFSKSMTILGDETQSIYSFIGLENWDEITNKIYKNQELKKANLSVSYRSTFEIMDTANHIIANANLPYPKVVPFNRHGDEIICKQIEDEDDLLYQIVKSIETFLDKGYKRIAIIHKDAYRSEGLFNALKEEGKVDPIVKTQIFYI